MPPTKMPLGPLNFNKNHLQESSSSEKEKENLEKECYWDNFQIGNLLEENKQIEMCCDDLKYKSNVLSKSLANLKILFEDTQKEVKIKDENLEKNIEEMNQRIIETDEQLKFKSNEVENLNNKVKELKFKLSLAEIKNNGINGELNELKEENNSKLNSVVKELKKKELEIELLNKDYKKVLDKSFQTEQEFRNTLESKTEKMKEIKVHLKSLKNSIEEKNKANKTKYNQVIAEIKCHNEELKQKFEASQDQNKKLMDEIEMLNSKTNTMEAEKSATTKSLESLVESKVEEICKVNLQLVDAKKSAKDKEAASSQLIDELKKKNKEYEQKVDSLCQLNENLKAQNEVLTQELKVENEKFKEIRKSLSTEKIQCVEYIQLKENDEKQIKELNKDLVESKKVIERLEEKVINLQNISQLEETKYKESNKQFKGESKIVAVKSDTTVELESNIASQNDTTIIDIHDTKEKVEVLENKLNEAEGTIADLKIKLSFKDDQLKQKDEYIAERIEYHEYQNTRSISIKTENKENNNEAMIMPSSLSSANQNDNLELREKNDFLHDLNKSYSAVILEKEDTICKLKKEIGELKSKVNQNEGYILKTRSASIITSSLVMEVTDESTVNYRSPEKRSIGDIQDKVNDEGEKKRKLR